MDRPRQEESSSKKPIRPGSQDTAERILLSRVAYTIELGRPATKRRHFPGTVRPRRTLRPVSVNPEQPDEERRLTHLDGEGRARMVDVSAKPATRRVARATATVVLTAEVRRALLAGELPKGEALAVARIAGIQAAKETSRLIPLCHPLALSSVEVELAPEGEDRMVITSEVSCSGATGVEMEALAAASVSALTLYDMCKALHRGICITDIQLLHKSGGRSGDWNRGD